MSDKQEGSSLPEFWIIDDDLPTDYEEGPPIYFTSQGDPYIYPHDLVRSKRARDKVKKFEAFAKGQNLQRAQGFGSSED